MQTLQFCWSIPWAFQGFIWRWLKLRLGLKLSSGPSPRLTPRMRPKPAAELAAEAAAETSAGPAAEAAADAAARADDLPSSAAEELEALRRQALFLFGINRVVFLEGEMRD